MLLALFTLLAPAEARIVDRVAAVVEKEVLTLSEVYDLGADFIEERSVGEGPAGPNRREAELEVLDILIQRALIEQEVERLDLSVTREEIDRAIDDVARRNGMSRDDLKAELKKQGFEWREYRGEVEQQLQEVKFNEMVIFPRIRIAEDEVISLYNNRIKDLETGGARRVQGILIPWGDDPAPEDRAAAASAATELVKRAREGEAWAKLVAEHPGSPYYAEGGDMGRYSPGELMASLDAAVFSTPVGGVAEPVALPTGLIVIRVASESAGAVPPLARVRADLEMELRQAALEEEVELWYNQARRRATVEVKGGAD